MVAARVSVLVALPAALTCGAAQLAAADTVVAQQFSTGVGGSVGIIAVIMGLGGVVAGLLRRRRIASARPVVADPRPAPPAPEPAGTAPLP